MMLKVWLKVSLQDQKAIIFRQVAQEVRNSLHVQLLGYETPYHQACIKLL